MNVNRPPVPSPPRRIQPASLLSIYLRGAGVVRQLQPLVSPLSSARKVDGSCSVEDLSKHAMGRWNLRSLPVKTPRGSRPYRQRTILHRPPRKGSQRSRTGVFFGAGLSLSIRVRSQMWCSCGGLNCHVEAHGDVGGCVDEPRAED